jgi:homoserine acetyltransferase
MGGPNMVKRALPFAGTAKTTPHDYIFVRAHEDALTSAWNGGFYAHQSDICMTDSDREQIDACIADLLKEEVA